MKNKLCDCRKEEAIYEIYKEDGTIIRVGQKCADWWKKIDPTVTVVLI